VGCGELTDLMQGTSSEEKWRRDKEKKEKQNF
jgi:hypothetical protein